MGGHYDPFYYRYPRNAEELPYFKLLYKALDYDQGGQGGKINI